MTFPAAHVPHAPASTSPARPNPLALALVAVGALAGVLAFTVLDWFSGQVGEIHGSASSVGDINDLVNRLVSTRRSIGSRSAIHLGLSQYYYTWLGWLLLASAVVVAVVAALPTSENRQLRYLGAMLGGLGLLATIWALDVYRAVRGHRPPRNTRFHDVAGGPGFGAFISHLNVGAWCALLAFVLIGAGALLGSRPAETSPSPAA